MGKPQDTVLIVDDNMTSLTLMRMMLKAAYNAIAVPSARKMFGVLEGKRPEIP